MTRNTKAKIFAEEFLKNTKAPVSLNELYTLTKNEFPKTSFSTVFRILNSFEKHGKVNKVDWRERGSRYEWAERPHHHHIVCESCDKVVDVPDELLNFKKEKINKKTGFTINSHSIEMSGLCSDCKK